MAFAVNLTATQLCRVTVAGAVDKKGNPAPLDGAPAFSSDNESLVTFTTDPADPNTGIASAVGPVTPPDTPVNLLITADALIGEGVENITEAGICAVTAGKAASFSVTVGTPEEQA